MKVYKGSFLGALTALLLSGCSGMNSDLGCNQVQGMSACTSMWTVNQMANQGAFNNTTRVLTNSDGQVVTTSSTNTPQGTSSSGSSDSSGASSTSSVPPASGNIGYMGPTPQPGSPIRYGETTQQIWIAPWVDTAGNYHEPSYIYAVVAPGHWLGSPAQAVQESN